MHSTADERRREQIGKEEKDEKETAPSMRIDTICYQTWQFWARFHGEQGTEVRAYATRMCPRSFQESILLPDVGRVPCSCHYHSKPSRHPP